MAKKDVEEWLSKADKDLDEARFLFRHKRPLENVAYFIHQAIEKYLKGFLIFNSWELEKIHDLVKLGKEACKFDESFEKFISMMEEITDFYIESRYPIGYDVEYTEEEIERAIKNAKSLGTLVKEKIEMRN